MEPEHLYILAAGVLIVLLLVLFVFLFVLMGG